jgi:flagellar biosynthesis regulator FlaF
LYCPSELTLHRASCYLYSQVFSDDKEKNQGRVDSVVDRCEHLLKENPVAQKDEKDVRDTVNNTQNSWNTILQRVDGVEQRFVNIYLCSKICSSLW